ncbi:RimK family alpha-L-glutamate ligase [Streptomyces sp. NPDC058653]|uniref:ATP-grasp domain-containing protein n=1 Tax=Streptomyces sp. NPDC058653 TaxID=3346576 RepID=UPI003656D275
MRICLITPRPDHPLLAGMTALLGSRHRIESIDPTMDGQLAAYEGESAVPLADVYLLKARTPQALALARSLEGRGATVVNSAAATELCQDRTAMAALAHRAGLPFAKTTTIATLRQLDSSPGLVHPLVVKSRRSRRDDLVTRVDTPAHLRALHATWGDEPVVVQPFTENSGWDRKLWVIGGHVFAALRRSELADAGERGPTLPLALGDLPDGWIELARAVGSVFALDVYGVDIIDAGGAALIVDINAFPGVRGQSGAPRALAALALRKARSGVAKGACREACR